MALNGGYHEFLAMPLEELNDLVRVVQDIQAEQEQTQAKTPQTKADWMAMIR